MKDRKALEYWVPAFAGTTVKRRIQTCANLLSFSRAESFQPGAREMVMAKGQMKSNKEKKKPKADKNLKKGGAAPANPFAAGKNTAGQGNKK